MPPNQSSDLVGHTDSAYVRELADGTALLYISGWLAHKTHSISKLEFSLGTSDKIQCTPFNRLDVKEKLPSLSHSTEVGYSIQIPIEKYEGNEEFSVSICISLSSGERLTSLLNVTAPKLIKANSQLNRASTIYGSEESIKAFKRISEIQFHTFLKSSERFVFEINEYIPISVVIVVHNQAALTYACLRSLIEQQDVGIEVTIIDNASTDETSKLLSRVYGARVITNKTNIHYLEAANQGAIASRGEYLLFLNNDLVLLPGSLKSALNVFRKESRVGAVGAKLIRPDGQLQEAGSLIFPDGSTIGRGLGQDPFDEKFISKAEVDYCSGAFLLTPRSLFLDLKMFDASYAPAYYEDVDYCVRLKEYGYRVIYEPGASAIHVHHGSAESNTTAYECMNRNRPLFAKRHAHFLSQLESAQVNPIQSKVTNLLFIDDFIPNPSLGQGQPRSMRILESLNRNKIPVSVIGVKSDPSSTEITRLPSCVTDRCNVSGTALENFILENKGKFSHLFVSRPTNMETIASMMERYPEAFTNLRIIYDAEAVFALRDIGRKSVLQNIQFTDEEVRTITQIETAYGRSADMVVTVSENEYVRFIESGFSRIEKLSHVVYPRFNSPPFKMRNGIMGLGPLLTSDSPNTDAVRWFTQQILPKLSPSLINDGIIFAGAISDEIRNALSHPLISLLGHITNPFELYDQSRIFIAPFRFGAGIPLKVIEAAAAGIPTVISNLAAYQLGWKNGYECLTANSAQEFADALEALNSDEKLWNDIQQNALKKVSEEFSETNFDHALKTILIHA